MSRGWRVCRHSTTNCSTITRKSSSESQQRNPNIDTRTETNYFKLDVVAQCVLLKLPRRKCRMMLSDRLSTSELQLVSRSNQKSLPSECEKSFRLSAAKEAILSKYCWVNVLLVWRNDLLNYTRTGNLTPTVAAAVLWRNDLLIYTRTGNLTPTFAAAVLYKWYLPFAVTLPN